MTRIVYAALAAASLVATRATAVPPPRASATFDLAGGAKLAAQQQSRGPRRAPSATRGITLEKRPHAAGEVRMNLGSRFEVLDRSSGALRLRDRVTGEVSSWAGPQWTDASGTETRITTIQEGDDLIAVIPPRLLDASSYPVVVDPQIGPEFSAAPATAQAVAFDGANYLVAWSSGGEIRASRISPQGTLLDPGGILVGPGNASANQLSVAFTNGVYLVTWTELGETIVDYTPYGGGTYIVIRAKLRTARIDAQGQVLDPGGVLIAGERAESCSLMAFCEGSYPTVAVAGDGTDFLIAWANQEGSTTVRLTSGGQVSSLNPVPGGPLRNPSIASDGSGYFLISWDLGRGVSGSTPNIVGWRLARDGTIVGSGLPLFDAGESWYYFPYYSSTDVNPRTSLTAAGDVFVASWTRLRDLTGPSPGFGPRDVLLSRLSPSGEILDAGGILLGEAQFGPNPPIVATVFDGCNVVSAWGNQAVRIAPDGSVLDATPWSIAGPLTAMATDGAGTVLVMSGTRGQLVRTCGSDETPPVVTVPAGVTQAATTSRGAAVSFSASALDDVSGSVPVTCSRESGSLFSPGVTRVACQATDEAGNVGTATFDVAVTFAWSGVLPPLDANGGSVFRRGVTIPVRFQLTGASSGITDLAATLEVRRVVGGVVGAVEVLSPWTGQREARFQYDPLTRQYVVNLATRFLWPATYEARIRMNDGVLRTVRFSLRR